MIITPAPKATMPFDAILDRIAHVADEMRLTNLFPQIAVCIKHLHADNGIDVAVFGRFKAGKSSFLNHLAGRAVLPVGVVPLTAVITRLRAGPVERAEVRFLDGRAEIIPLAELGRFVGENENPDNAKRVASVDVELPSLQPLAPLQFVDTPGLGSAFAHNTEVALNWLPHVGAALVAVSADAPLSERDLVLLDELRRHTPKIVLLLTKADLLTEDQRAEVLAFVRQQLQRRSKTEWPVFFYSIRPGFEGLKTALERDLFAPLIRGRDTAGREILRHKLNSLIAQTLDYLNIALAAATRTESSRQALREGLAEERRQFGLLRDELRVLAQRWAAGALQSSLEHLQGTQRDLQARVTAGLESVFPDWRLRLPAFLAAYRHWLQDFLARELGAVSHSQQAMFCEPLHKARQHLGRTLRAFHDRLAQQVQAALGVALSPREFDLAVSEPSAPPVDVGYAFDAPMDIVGHVVPMSLFRRPVERYLLRAARYEVEKNLSRLAAAWGDRVAAGIRALVSQAEEHATNELAALEQTLAQTKSDEPQLRAAINELDTLRAGLQAA